MLWRVKSLPRRSHKLSSWRISAVNCIGFKKFIQKKKAHFLRNLCYASNLRSLSLSSTMSKFSVVDLIGLLPQYIHYDNETETSQTGEEKKKKLKSFGGGNWAERSMKTWTMRQKKNFSKKILCAVKIAIIPSHNERVRCNSFFRIQCHIFYIDRSVFKRASSERQCIFFFKCKLTVQRLYMPWERESAPARNFNFFLSFSFFPSLFLVPPRAISLYFFVVQQSPPPPAISKINPL